MRLAGDPDVSPKPGDVESAKGLAVAADTRSQGFGDVLPPRSLQCTARDYVQAHLYADEIRMA